MMQRYTQAIELLTQAMRLMEDADDTLVMALLAEPLDLITVRLDEPTLGAAIA